MYISCLSYLYITTIDNSYNINEYYYFVVTSEPVGQFLLFVFSGTYYGVLFTNYNTI